MALPATTQVFLALEAAGRAAYQANIASHAEKKTQEDSRIKAVLDKSAAARKR